MEKKINFIWLYGVILFSAALFLIAIGAVAQYNLAPSEVAAQPELERLQAFNHTAQQNIVALIEENKTYKERLAVLEETASTKTLDASRLSANDALFRASVLNGEGKKDAARDELSLIDTAFLSESAMAEYNALKKALGL